jgi:hypothetical protein
VGLVAVLVIAVMRAVAFAQAPTASLHVTVVDPSGAVIVGAQVTVGGTTVETGPRGDATFSGLEPGRYAIAVESAGFEARELKDQRLRAGDNRRDVKLAIAKLAETVQVGRDARERASDPRSDAFATILGQAEINELPDDPDEMEQMLRDMAGPGAVMRVNGFRGGRLPPKDQIQQIRFRRNQFAADAHEPGFVAIDIITKPGFDAWRGGTTSAFRDDALNARNPFAPTKGDERLGRFGLSLNGPLWKQHTSLSAAIDGLDAYDSKTIVAALPTGYFADSIRKPNDTINGSVRVEHMLSKAQMLRAEVQRNRSVLDNLGVGDFDLASRAYRQETTQDVFRASVAGSIRKTLYNEFRVQWQGDDTVYTPASAAPAVLVLNAFNDGGAQIAGATESHVLEVSNDLDIPAGRHAIRAGFLLDAGRYTTNTLRNGTGTFTFASLAAYDAASPTTYTRNVGNPAVATAMAQFGAYVQDDFRIRKDLTLSGGVRQEIQSHIGGLNLAPRGGIAWSPFKSGKTTVRAGGGRFFDWMDAQTYQQAVQLDGTHEQTVTVVDPGFPEVRFGAESVVLPAGRVQFAPNLTQPELRETSAGVEQQLPHDIRLNTMFIHRTGSHLLRGVNVNPGGAPITEIRSDAESRVNALSFNVNYGNPARRIFIAANYTLASAINETDSPFALPADSANLSAERGPAANDARHRFMSLVQLPIAKRVRFASSVRVQSALPYNITTGHDDNGDTISNDRPVGVTRNSARGAALVDIGTRVSWSLGFGGRAAPPSGPQVRIVRGDNADPLAATAAMGDVQNKYSLELYVQASNVTNHFNALNFSGVMTSPFFGQPTSASPPRRVEIGARVGF